MFNGKSVTTVITVLLPALSANAQIQVNQGRITEANTQVASGGLNADATNYQPGRSNLITSGNITGGASFRGYEPIRSGSSLYIGSPAAGVGSSGFSSLFGGQLSQGLPSDSLSNFRRDSVNMASIQGHNYVNPIRPYFSDGEVINTGGIVAGYNLPGTSRPRSSYLIPDSYQPIDANQPLLPNAAERQGRLLEADTQILRVDTNAPVQGPINTRLLESSLFSGVRSVSMREAALLTDPGHGYDPLTGGLDPNFRHDGPLDPRVDARIPAEITPSMLADPNARAVPGEPGVDGEFDQDAGDFNDGDVFTQMRQQVSSFSRPIVAQPQTLTQGEFRTGQGGETTPPGGSGGLGGQPGGGKSSVGVGTTFENRAAIAALAEDTLLNSFVGTEETVLNQYLKQGEKLLESGDYYRAARVFAMARTVDLSNPLPLIGRSMAFLAAGDYMTSSSNLFLAIQLYEDLAAFRVDLNAFVTDVNLLDKRRADLENQLAKYEDFRLRFLLGYAEYCSGMTARGLEDLEKGALAAPPEFAAVRRYVQYLNRKHADPDHSPEPRMEPPPR